MNRREIPLHTGGIATGGLAVGALGGYAGANPRCRTRCCHSVRRPHASGMRCSSTRPRSFTKIRHYGLLANPFLAGRPLASSALLRPAARTSRDAVPGAGAPPGPGTFALYIYGRPADSFLQP
jgi:hypothetical protein